MKYKLNVIVGFRDSQKISIDSEEAHRAYYLFLHPNERGVFENGIALRGVDIQRIEPDYQGSMGWNSTHQLDDDDWNEIRKIGLDKKIRQIMNDAQFIAKMDNPQISRPLSELINLEVGERNHNLIEETRKLSDKFKIR